MNIKKQIRLILFLVFSIAFLNVNHAYAVDFDIVWTDIVGVNAVGNNLSKTSGASVWDSGAVSNLSFTGDGGVRFTSTEINTHRMLGLSTDNTDEDFKTIDYAIYLINNGNVAVYENGSNKGTVSTYQAGDIFSVERVGTEIQYKKNSALLYTSTVAVVNTQSLIADTSLYTVGSTITNAQFIGLVPAVPQTIMDLGAEVFNQQINLTWTPSQNNGSPLTEYEIQYGTVTSGLFDQIVTDDTMAGVTISGLINGTEYQFRVVAKNAIGTSAYPNVVKATPNLITDVVWTDVVGVSAVGNNLTKTNGTSVWDSGAVSNLSFTGDGGVRFTSTEINTHRMLGLSTDNTDADYKTIDYAIYLLNNGNVAVYENGSNKGIVSTYQFGDIFSVERVGTEIQYKKNSVLLYTSTVAVVNAQSLVVDTSLYTLGSTITNAQFIGGFASAPDAITDLSIQLIDNQRISLLWTAPQNNGDPITGYEMQYGTLASGLFDQTVMDDAIVGATISGLVNGTEYQFRVVAKNSVGTSGFSNSVTAIPAVAGIDIVWVDVVGATATGNSLVKTTTNGWGNSGAASSTSFAGDGGAKFTVSETNTHRMFGLSTTNADAHFITIDYAIYLFDGGDVFVFENGLNYGLKTSHQSGDVFSIERVGTTILYKKNNILFYTSPFSIVANQALLVDVALNTLGCTITDAKFFGVVLGAPTAINDLGVEPDDQESLLFWTTPSNNGSPITEYEVQYGTVASGLFDMKVITNNLTPETTVFGLTNGVEYQFRIISKNALGISNVSNVITAIPNIMLEKNVVWTDLVGVSTNRNSLTKTVGNAWGNSGAASTISFVGNGGAGFTVTEINSDRAFGLSTSNPNAEFSSLDYSVKLDSNGSVSISERIFNRGIVTTVQPGDILSIKREGTTVFYQKNGNTVYTSLTPMANEQPLLVDVALNTLGSTITNAQFLKIPSKVTNLISNVQNTQISLSWDAIAFSGGYTVKYGTMPGVYDTTINVASGTNYTVTNLVNGIEYYFTVSAYNIHGESLNSDEITLIPGALINYFYDNRNRLNSVTDGNINIQYDYDSLGNINNKSVF